MYRNIRQSKIYLFKNSIAAEEAAQSSSTAWHWEDIIAANAKKEIVGLHLEAEYRVRLNKAYVQVKKSLYYQVTDGAEAHGGLAATTKIQSALLRRMSNFLSILQISFNKTKLSHFSYLNFLKGEILYVHFKTAKLSIIICPL